MARLPHGGGPFVFCICAQGGLTRQFVGALPAAAPSPSAPRSSLRRSLRWRSARCFRWCGCAGARPGQGVASLRARRVALVLKVEDLIELVAHDRVAGAAGGYVVGCVALDGVAGGVVRRRGGRGWGRTRRVCGRGSHTEAGGGADVVEHSDNARITALAIRKAGNVRTDVRRTRFTTSKIWS